MQLRNLFALGAIAAVLGALPAMAADPAGTMRGAGGTIISAPECNVATNRIRPPGFTEHLLSWEQAFYGAVFPAMPATLAPVGSFTLKALAPETLGPTMNARYVTVPFVPEKNTSYKVVWAGAQPIAPLNYLQARPSERVFVSVSPCKGDLRPQSVFSPSTALSKCRLQTANGVVSFGTTPNIACPLTAGKKYFLNITFVDTSGDAALSTTETTCFDGARCEANFTN